LRTTLLFKFATGINHTSGTGRKIYGVVTVVYLDLRISPQIFGKNLNRGLGGRLFMKKCEAKNLLTLTL
jgi:hypothetical protein